MSSCAAVLLDVEVSETMAIESRLKGKIVNQEMKTRVRTLKKMEIANDGNNMPIKPKAPSLPESESKISEHGRIATTLSTSHRHKPKPAIDADGHTQQGE